MQNTAVTLNQVSQLLPKLLKANVVPFIHGSPGVGKSAIVKSIADKFNLELIDVRLSQLDPSDMLGLPTFNSNKVKYLPPEIFPIEGDTLPKGKSGWLLFLN